MAAILCIETSTKVCAVGLSLDGKMVSSREDRSDAYSHAELLNVYIDEVMRGAGLGFGDLQAIAVSGGPGSYTGLRIGVSAAKGLAYAKNLKLIAVDPLKALAVQVSAAAAEQCLLLPMMDARRMEVYCAGFDSALNTVFATRAEVVTEQSFPETAPYAQVLYFGDGADKCADTLSADSKFRLLPGIKASVLGMAPLAEADFAASNFVDVAYFEPFYLKEFQAGKPKSGG